MRRKEYEILDLKERVKRLEAEKAHLETLVAPCSICMDEKAAERINDRFYCAVCMRRDGNGDNG